MSEVKQEITHSVRVPRFYKVASNILQLVQEKGASLKGVIFDKAGRNGSRPVHPNIKGIYALVVSCINNGSTLDRLVRESRILVKEDRLDPWLARVLIGELLWGKKKLPPSTAKPLLTVLEYEATFVGILREAVKGGTHENEPRQNRAQVKPRYIRVNTLLMTVGDAITAFRHEGWRRATPPTDDYPGYLLKLAALEEDEFLQDFHVKQLFAFPPRTEFFDHELYRNGSLILQDKATCLAPLILNPTPGSAVLDMCAAPGMKTTQLAAIMENKGTLYAVERHPMRYKTLCEFIPHHGATCVTTIHADATTITPQECREVEYILVDPTCSGSGMDRPSSSKDQGADPGRLAQLAAFQVILLERALTKFPRARRVVYSTCSIHAEENEQVVERVLAIVNADRPTFRLAGDALESWPNRGSAEYEVGSRCLVAHPERDMTTGFFVAVFDRVQGGQTDDVNTLHAKKKKEKKEKRNKKLANEDGDISGVGEHHKGRTQGDGSEKADVGREDKKTKKHEREKSQMMAKNGAEDSAMETGIGRKKRKKGETKENGQMEETKGDAAGQDVSGKGKKKKKERSREGTKAEEGDKVGADNEKATEDSRSEPKKQKKERKNEDGKVEQEEGKDIDRKTSSCEGKKEKKSKRERAEEIDVTSSKEDGNGIGTERKKRKKERALEKNGGVEENDVDVQDHKDAGEGKKKKNKKHRKDKQESGDDNKVDSTSKEALATSKPKHKKRKEKTVEV